MRRRGAPHHPGVVFLQGVYARGIGFMEPLPLKPPKTFTVSEADALLPDISRIIRELQALQGSIVQTSEQQDEVTRKVTAGNGYPIQQLRAQIEETTARQLKLIEGYQRALKELEDLGAVLKDVNLGLIDFYSIRDNALIFLCWKLGEDRIRFWHSLEGGFAGRLPLD